MMSRRSGVHAIVPYVALPVAFALVAMIALVDRSLSYHHVLIMFYIVPIYLAVWFSGRTAGVIVVLCSIISWFASAHPENVSLYHAAWLYYLTISVRIAFLLMVVYFLARLKALMAHERALITDLQSLNARLDEVNKKKDAFVGNVSHELQSPLMIVTEYTDLLMSGTYGAVSGRQQEVLGTVRRRIMRLLLLVRDLLDVAKIEAGKMHLSYSPVSMDELVHNEARDFSQELAKGEITLTVDAGEGTGIVWGDADKLSRVISNLLSNAIKYTPQKGRIVITVTGSDDACRLSIWNDGPEIPPEYHEKIFDKFETIRAAGARSTGLGLAIVKDIIVLHGGKIWVESGSGKGTTFTCSLPRDARSRR